MPRAFDSFSTVPAEHLSSSVFPEQMSERVAQGMPLTLDSLYLLMFLSDMASSYDQALDLQRRVYAGENFATLAAQYSKCPSGRNGGDLGWFGRGQMVKPFEDAAFSYNPGDMTIVQTQFGWHLIYVYGQR